MHNINNVLLKALGKIGEEITLEWSEANEGSNNSNSTKI